MTRTEQNISLSQQDERRHNRIDGQHLEFSVEPNEEKMTDLMDMYIYTDEHNPMLSRYQPPTRKYLLERAWVIGDR